MQWSKKDECQAHPGEIEDKQKHRGKGMILKASRRKKLITYKGSELITGNGLKKQY